MLGVRAADNFGAFPQAWSAFTHRMPYIQLSDKQYPLKVGQTTVGTSGADITVSGPSALGVQAKLETGADNSVIIRRASSESVVRVNGVQLGVDPTPLIHGDKIEVSGAEILFGDDRKAGQTQALAGLKVDDVYQPRTSGGKATAATGGRLVSLVDGREYIVSPTGITIGRDAGCDVVVPSPEVSRKHAELMASAGGYTVTDLSTNGVFVNGERVARVRTLARGDVLRLGTEEFRFYADVLPTPAAMPAAVPAPVQVPVAASVSAPVVAAAAVSPGASALETPPAHARADIRPVLATLELMNEGALKGKRFEIRAPLTHVGRGAHNDIVLTDDTVSDSHAKIQKRETGWILVDMGSSNGTYAGGQRINGEATLTGQASVRFGAIRGTFVPAADAREDGPGTRVIAGLNKEQARKMSREVGLQAEAAAPPQGGIPAWVWLLVVVLIAAGAFFILKVR